jgi:putative nucleotidyltransferase with HDIG domain
MASRRGRSFPAAFNAWHYLPLTVLTTALVIVLPAVAVHEIVPADRPAWAALSVPLVILLSLGVASCGSALWIRRPQSRSVVFADLMPWGWLRRLRTERRLTRAHDVLGFGSGVSGDHRVEALTRLAAQLEARDAYTHGHSRRVARHAERIAREMRLSPAEVARVRTAAALHDVGKIETPREILNKPGRLSDTEYAIVRRHPGDGADMLAGIGDPEITAMVRHHHERLDGAGYPLGLSGSEIPIGARIIAVADTFDAITSSRAYRKAATHKRALDVLSREAGTQLDAAAVGAFLRYYRGRRSVGWSALMTIGPHRLLTSLGGSTQSLGAGIVQLPALGTAAVLAVAPIGLATAGGRAADQRPVTVKRTVAARPAARHAELPAPAPARNFTSTTTSGSGPDLRPRRTKGRMPAVASRQRPSRHTDVARPGGAHAAPNPRLSSTPAPTPEARSTPDPAGSQPEKASEPPAPKPAAPHPKPTPKPAPPKPAPPKPAPPKPAPHKPAPPRPAPHKPAPPKPAPPKPAPHKPAPPKPAPPKPSPKPAPPKPSPKPAPPKPAPPKPAMSEPAHPVKAPTLKEPPPMRR